MRLCHHLAWKSISLSTYPVLFVFMALINIWYCIICLHNFLLSISLNRIKFHKCRVFVLVPCVTIEPKQTSRTNKCPCCLSQFYLDFWFLSMKRVITVQSAKTRQRRPRPSCKMVDVDFGGRSLLSNSTHQMYLNLNSNLALNSFFLSSPPTC